VSTEFWSWVEAERTSRGLSERRLAVVSGLDPSTLCQARQRNSEPSRKVVIALARGLGVPQRMLLLELGYTI
jgi:transcriptional regulator with XRE-family HTH domain